MNPITRKAQIVIVANDSAQLNKFLLLKTNLERGAFWQNCTGKIEEEEDFRSGAIREVMEETGLQDENIFEVIDLNLEHHFLDRWKRNVHEKAYLIIVKRIWNVVIDPNEHQDFQWIEGKDLNPNSVKYSGNFEALQVAYQKIKG